MPALSRIKAELHKWDRGQSEDDDTFKAAVVMLAATHIGQDVRKLAQFTGYPYALVAKFSINLRTSGIWRNGKTYADWDDKKEGGAAFAIDTCVAVGWLKRC
jgi:hypothetical protein